MKLPGDGWNGIESFDHLIGGGEQRRWYVKTKLNCPRLGLKDACRGRHRARHGTMAFHIAADASGAAASDTGFIKMPDPKDDPKSSEWRPYIFARDQWHCRICGDRFLYSEMVRKHIANEHNETMPPSMYEYFQGAVWQRKKLP